MQGRIRQSRRRKMQGKIRQSRRRKKQGKIRQNRRRKKQSRSRNRLPQNQPRKRKLRPGADNTIAAVSPRIGRGCPMSLPIRGMLMLRLWVYMYHNVFYPGKIPFNFFMHCLCYGMGFPQRFGAIHQYLHIHIYFISKDAGLQ